jgi:tetratricopeptide (TPR) repeat protein
MRYRLTILSAVALPLVIFLQTTFLVLCLVGVGVAQSEELGDGSADPVKLFERGQAAHARGELEQALGFYEEAIKVKPRFPEAEFQRGNVLTSLGAGRFVDAEMAFRRAIELRSDWSLPYSALGVLLVRTSRDKEAQSLLERALALDSKDNVALRLLADLKLRSGDTKEALKLAQRATSDSDAPVSAWLLRAMAEKALGEKAEARKSLTHALEIDSRNLAALVARAQLLIDAGEYPAAIEDLKTAEGINKDDKQILSLLVLAYERWGKPEEARRIAESAGLMKAEEASPGGTIKVIASEQEIAAANSEDPVRARKALATLLEKNPNNAMLLARLGASYRTDDPARSLEFYHRASELQPNNSDYATGYASALVQARRFTEAIKILSRVLAVAPDSYSAHANLATALYESKRFAEAIAEYRWLIKSKPHLVVAYYFIATAHDYLGEYEEALPAYEAFLASAQVQENQLEIEKVKLRLPSLKRQIQIGQGVKRKK